MKMAGLKILCVLVILVVCSVSTSVLAEYTFANSTIVAFVTNVNTGGYPEVGLMYPQVNNTVYYLTNQKATHVTVPRVNYDHNTVVYATTYEYKSSGGQHFSQTTLYQVKFNGSTITSPASKFTDLSSVDYSEHSGDWSPDGTKLVIEYTWRSPAAKSSQNYIRLGVINSDGTGFTPIMENLSKGYNDYYGRWSPDGKTILFASDRENWKGTLYYYDIATAEVTKIPGLPDMAGATGNGPSWLPSGSAFLYEADLPGPVPMASSSSSSNSSELADKSQLQEVHAYMVQVDRTGHSYTPLFPIPRIITQGRSGVLEYVQCVTSPSGQEVVCTQSSDWADNLVVLDIKTGQPTGHFTNSTSSLPSKLAVNWFPDWD